MSSKNITVPQQTADLLREEISLRAHQFWLERGCPIGSPEEDWLRAEAEIRLRTAQPTVQGKGVKTQALTASA
jgi:hypothetical protein